MLDEKSEKCKLNPLLEDKLHTLQLTIYCVKIKLIEEDVNDKGLLVIVGMDAN